MKEERSSGESDRTVVAEYIRECSHVIFMRRDGRLGGMHRRPFPHQQDPTNAPPQSQGWDRDHGRAQAIEASGFQEMKKRFLSKKRDSKEMRAAIRNDQWYKLKQPGHHGPTISSHWATLPPPTCTQRPIKPRSYVNMKINLRSSRTAFSSEEAWYRYTPNAAASH